MYSLYKYHTTLFDIYEEHDVPTDLQNLINEFTGDIRLNDEDLNNLNNYKKVTFDVTIKLKKPVKELNDKKKFTISQKIYCCQLCKTTYNNKLQHFKTFGHLANIYNTPQCLTSENLLYIKQADIRWNLIDYVFDLTSMYGFKNFKISKIKNVKFENTFTEDEYYEKFKKN